MDGERSAQALTRIEAALARIEAAARAPRPAGTEAELAALQGRHARLKAAVTESLEQLDALIEGAQG